MPRTLKDTFLYVTLMGIFVSFTFWWSSGSTMDERAGNLWMLLLFIPLFVVAYLALAPRIPQEVS